MKNDSFVASRRSFSKLTRSRLETHCCLSNDSFKQMFMVSSRGMLVNNEVMSRLAIKQSEFCCSISLAKSNESLTLYSLEVKSLSTGTRNLAILYMGVPINQFFQPLGYSLKTYHICSFASLFCSSEPLD